MDVNTKAPDAVRPVGGRAIVQISDQLLCLFNADVREDDGGYHVEIPRRELETGAITAGSTYRVALIERAGSGTNTSSTGGPPPGEPQPPVEVGEVRYVEIEDIGKQGDGIARVERGYVIIVPGGNVDDQVKIEVTEVKSNFAVGEILEDELA